MRAMILAAGRGERLRPLTDTTPKPLIEVGGSKLIEYHIHALKAAGVRTLIINVAWLGDKIKCAIGNGSSYGVEILYSDESGSALETAGGIVKALSLLGTEPFIVCNADIWTDYDYGALRLRENYLAHLVLVDNPDHHPQGDFSLRENTVCTGDKHTLTYAGIGVYHPAFFSGLQIEKNALAPLLYSAIKHQKISGEHYLGDWCDVGSESRLLALRNRLKESFG